jgi:hypothetical protein
MKAMQLTGLRRLEMREVPEPELAGETGVLVELGGGV